RSQRSTMKRLARSAGIVALFSLVAASVSAQTVRGTVLDQTGLPLPGAMVRLVSGSSTVTAVTTGLDGSFTFDAALAGDTVVASLDGFEMATVPRAEAH